jgi:microcystin-dependent protein
MGLETVNDDGTARLHQLDTANPTGTDNKNQGDDHIRNIKKAIKDQFSGISGDNSSGAVTATAAELNKLDGCTATTSNLNALAGIDNIFNVIYPVGCIYESTSPTNPSTLFTGTTWSAFGEGKMLVGLDPNDSDFNSTSDSGGSKTVTLTENQIPSHDHNDTFSIVSVSDHTHGDTFATSGAGGHKHVQGVPHSSNLSNSDTDAYSARFSAEANTGGNRRSSQYGGASLTDDYPYTSTVSDHTHTITGSVQSAGGHTHTLNGSVSSAGGGQAHDNMPPYVVVYRWKRDS